MVVRSIIRSVCEQLTHKRVNGRRLNVVVIYFN